MAIKTTLNYSPNFDPKKRKTNQIKFLIFHYTGMKTEKAAINRLTDIESRVSAHYLIKQNGEIITLGSRFIYCMACRKVCLEKLYLFKQRLYWY
jgi:N-acetyl-anhydromuramyl-L-alanine amidase AmpD